MDELFVRAGADLTVKVKSKPGQDGRAICSFSGHRRASGDQGQLAAGGARLNRAGRGCGNLQHSAGRGDPRKHPTPPKYTFNEGNDMSVARLLLTLALVFTVCGTPMASAQQAAGATTPSASDITPTAEEPAPSP